MAQTARTRETHEQVKLAVIGAGAWGTVLATLLAQNGHDVRLWARRESVVRTLQVERVNADYLPGVALPANLRVTADGAEATAGVEAAFLAVPSKGLRAVLVHLPAVPAYVSCAKGLEPLTLKRLSEVVADYQPEAALGALSGPNLAQEIARGLPAGATVASADTAFAGAVQRWLNHPSLRVYTSSDLIGVEVAGAVKNVIALAAGISDGLGLGDNAKASIITRGLAEIVRLGTRLGGQVQTFYGLAGLGDVVATCYSPQSRNRGAGERLARGSSLAELEGDKTATEGVRTVQALMDYAAREGLDLPIARAVYEVIYEGKPARQGLRELMARDVKPEW